MINNPLFLQIFCAATFPDSEQLHIILTFTRNVSWLYIIMHDIYEHGT
jgi:hypothetical protein